MKVGTQVLWTISIIVLRLVLELFVGKPTRRERVRRLNRVSLDFFFAGVTLSLLVLLKRDPPSPIYVWWGAVEPEIQIPAAVVLVVLAVVVVALHAGGEKMLRKKNRERKHIALLWLQMGATHVIGFLLLVGAAALLIM